MNSNNSGFWGRFFAPGRGLLLWRDVVGPAIVLLGVAVSEWFLHAYPACPEPAPLVLVAVVMAGFLSQVNSAVLSSTIGVAYAVIYVQERHAGQPSPLPISIEAAFLVVSAPLLAIMASLLRGHASRSVDKLRKHLANTPLAVIELSPTFEVRQWAGSAESIFGIRAEQALGASLFELPGVFFDGQDAKQVRGLLEKLSRGVSSKAVVQTERQGEDGSRGHSRWFWSSALGPDGRHSGFLVLVEDVTDRILAEQALRNSKGEIIERLVRAAELRDSETGDHIVRMARYAEQLAIALGMPESESALIRAAAPMHDIGKIGIPDHLLRKPGRLTPEEYELMKTHTTIGGQVLAGSSHELVKMAESIALTHHERWDGKGYPQGLKGFEIPLVGRICAVCDVFDALTSERHYKDAWATDEAVAEMRRLAGSQLDPKLVETFLDILPSILAIREEYRKGQPALNEAA